MRMGEALFAEPVNANVMSYPANAKGDIVAARAETYRPAGIHLLIDLWEADNLADIEVIRATLVEAAGACGATLLDVQLHGFGPGQGITGVALLAESHISIHSWPEHGYAAIDVFVCGACDPHAVLPVLRNAFRPERVELTAQPRGVIPQQPRAPGDTHSDERG